MLSRTKVLSFMACAALTALPSLVHGQVIYSDGDFLASDYTSSGSGIRCSLQCRLQQH